MNRRECGSSETTRVSENGEGQNFKRRRFSETQPFVPSSVRTKYIQPPGCRSPSMTVSETPGRTIGPGLLLDESPNNGMLPPGACSSTVTVTFCPSLNIGSSGGTTAGAAAGATPVVGEVAGAKGAEASLLGLEAACGAGAGGATGAGANGFGLMAVGGGVLSPRKGLSHSVTISGSIET